MTAAEASGRPHTPGDGQVPVSSSSHGSDTSDLPTENLPTNEDGDAPSASTASGSALPEVFKHLNPVTARVKGLGNSVKMTFNEVIAPSTVSGFRDAQDGWRTKVAPSLESGASSVASFFQNVTDKARVTHDRLRENETWRTVGDGFSKAGRSTIDTLREGTKEFRVGVADLMTSDPSPAPGVPAMANFFDVTRRNGTGNARGNEDEKRFSNEENSSDTNEKTDAALKEKNASGDGVLGGDGKEGYKKQLGVENPGGVLGVRLETLCLWDAQQAPVPYVVLSTTQWLSGSSNFFNTPSTFAGVISGDDDVDGATKNRHENVAALLGKFSKNQTYLIPPETDPAVVIGALWAYLEAMPEPLVSFSLFAALARGGSGGNGYGQLPSTSSTSQTSETEKSDAVETLLGLLPLCRRTSLECVLRLAASVAVRHETTRMDAESVAFVLAPKIAWPRGGRWDAETVSLAGDQTYEETRADKQTRELRAVADAARLLVARRVTDPQ